MEGSGYFPFGHQKEGMAVSPKMILCDTNVIIEALKKNPSAIQSLEEIGFRFDCRQCDHGDGALLRRIKQRRTR